MRDSAATTRDPFPLYEMLLDGCEWLDEHLPHRGPLWYVIPFRRLICSAADTSYGWNPEAIDWEERATWLDRWINRNLPL